MKPHPRPSIIRKTIKWARAARPRFNERRAWLDRRRAGIGRRLAWLENRRTRVMERPVCIEVRCACIGG